MTRILLVENHPVAATGLRVLIDSDPDLQTQIKIIPWTAEQNLSQASADFIFLSMNYQSAEHRSLATPVSRAIESGQRLVIFCDESQLASGLKFLYLGAAGLLSQETEPDEILQCIRKVIAGKTFVCQRSIRKILDLFIANILAGEGNPLSFILSPPEQDVVQLLLKGQAIKEVAMNLDMTVSKASVLKASAFRKLRVRNLFELTNRVRAVFGK